LVGTDEVDLHDHGDGPGEPLVDAEQHVREHDPSPGGREDQQQRHRQADEPAGQQHRLATEPVGEGAGEVVDDRLGDAEGDDEGQHRGVAGQGELLLGQQRQHRAFLPDEPTDERVDPDQQRELRQVLA
jgi:hypothetical protein